MGDDFSSFTLDDLNRLQRKRNLGGIIFVSILLAVGLIGNVHVIAIFGWKFKQSNYRIFSLALAAIDMLSCSVGMPFVVFELLNPLKFHIEYLCKLTQSSNFFCGISSILLLLVITVDRYRKVCRPLRSQIQSTLARVLVIMAMSISLLVSWPAFVMFGNSSVSSESLNVSGVRCDYEDEYVDTKYPTFYNGFLFMIVFGTFVVYLVIYSLIGRTLWRHSKMRLSMTQNANGDRPQRYESKNKTQKLDTDEQRTKQCKDDVIPEPVSNGNIDWAVDDRTEVTDSNVTNNTALPEDVDIEMETHLESRGEQNTDTIDMIGTNNSEVWSTARAQDSTTRNKPHSHLASHSAKLSANNTTQQSKAEQMKQATKQKTLIFFVVALVFFVSYFPSIIARLFSIIKTGFFSNLSETEWVVFNTFLWSFFVNNVANPIIYYSLDNKFREEIRRFYKLTR